MDKQILYCKNFIFEEVKSSPIIVQLEEDEKKLGVQLQPRIVKSNLNGHEVNNGPNEEEVLKNL